MVHLKVKLVAWTSGGLEDPRRLIVLAIKTSAGKIRLKGAEHYIRDYKEEDMERLMVEAYKYPMVLEHVSFTFLIEGISRVTSHQLVRHRLASYTQESQRYSSVDKSFVVPPSVVEKGFEEKYRKFLESAFELYEEMVRAGIPQEDARYIIPQAVETRILMSVNLRELLHIACLRLSPHAQWEIRELVSLMLKEAQSIIPEIPLLLREMCRTEK
ncbi:MAG TPA: FAD-dependent thymidylate synthase [Fervidicoccus fontis]|uniref:Flavin-dependent thymidylate synthase n=1 Tax=Fervidicoccus fontis TaxID=683846 RepID=A0A7C2YTW1_9CREN|nr:FAD-dependent thymidylate synthase [Fervidicoccus fontis]